ncbi:MAG TPA: hypothetical protein HPP80_07005 [Rhodospirillaceae bacterium]|nr:hypothetical protein [Rhodospirillaceae bacterium]
MFKFIGKALTGLVLTKEAREAAEQIAVAKGLLPAQPAGQPDEATDPAEPAEQASGTDRAALIRQAMQVRAAKQTILSDLDDETRAKLVAVAMKALLNEGRTKE